MKIEIMYEPLPKQAEFHNSTATYRVLAGGFGSGKTMCGAAEAIQLSVEYPRNLGLVGRMSYPELRDTTRKELLDFPVQVDGKESTLLGCPFVKSFNKSENILEFKNGSAIIFRALDESFHKIKSLNLGWFWIDELTEAPEEMWLGLIGRLRRKGVRHTGFGTTNPEGHDWVWKRWIMQKLKDHFIVQSPSVNNKHLPSGYIESLREQYPDEWVKRYIDCSFETFEGLVYKEFVDGPPYVISEMEIPEEWYRFVSVDHGYRNPTCVLWFAVSPKGQVFVYDEYYETEKLVSDIALAIKTKTGKQKIQKYLIDPSCKNRNGISGRSIIDEFEDHGIYFEPANNDVRAGINHTQEYFRQVEGKPKLRIFQACRNLRSELQTYKWRDLKPGSTQDSPEKPVKRNDHSCDSLRYGTIYLYDTPTLAPKNTGWRKWKFGDYNPSLQVEEQHWMSN